MKNFEQLHETNSLGVNAITITEFEFNTIQLDAFKAGAEWAAGHIHTREDVKQIILSASSNLKKIPK